MLLASQGFAAKKLNVKPLSLSRNILEIAMELRYYEA